MRKMAQLKMNIKWTVTKIDNDKGVCATFPNCNSIQAQKSVFIKYVQPLRFRG